MTTEQTAGPRTDSDATPGDRAVGPSPDAPLVWDPQSLPPARSESPVRTETEAAIGGLAAGLLAALFAAIMFVGKLTPIWGGWSVGSAAMGSVAVACLAASITGYWRSRTQPGQRWRLTLPSWKFIVDTAAVAVVHVAIAAIVTFGAFTILQQGFRDLLVDGYAAIAAVAVGTGLATYAVYLSVSKLTTVTMSQLLVVFMTLGTFASMAISTDPHWWRYHFSHLGTFGDRGSSLFNVTLIVAGVLVTTFALYVDRDLRLLHDRGVIRSRRTASAVSTLFVLLGIALAGIGIIPINLSVVVHNVFSAGASIVFAVMLVSAPVLLRGMPWQFFLVTAGFFLALVGAGLLHFVLNYFNLTAFELVAYIILFGWIAVFVRFLAAVLRSEERATT
ncbi:uncharacterized protein DUF998 [Labedella gwakjiensis]|uniref:DUF998 domain-containing protein n=1 Tax=Labedella gwakjiensis TaxID=390269 RepID=A0A2P8GS58_9MICO|nr:DUF998 domain-containing protein [Labedella gwakjiensis]PSL36798.1 uncharacterized protein DUF998 [Labedella gwakjiensis]RUQ84308.1 DUF998 domain-containing protein [Labedella gwakjiensis]